MLRADTKHVYMYSVQTQVFKSICGQQLEKFTHGTQGNQRPTVAENLGYSDIVV